MELQPRSAAAFSQALRVAPGIGLPPLNAVWQLRGPLTPAAFSHSGLLYRGPELCANTWNGPSADEPLFCGTNALGFVPQELSPPATQPKNVAS